MSPFFQSRGFPHPSSALPREKAPKTMTHTRARDVKGPLSWMPKCNVRDSFQQRSYWVCEETAEPASWYISTYKFPTPTSVLFSYHIQISKKDICNLSFYKTLAGISLPRTQGSDDQRYIICVTDANYKLLERYRHPFQKGVPIQSISFDTERRCSLRHPSSKGLQLHRKASKLTSVYS